jgi:hypothetical protein
MPAPGAFSFVLPARPAEVITLNSVNVKTEGNGQEARSIIEVSGWTLVAWTGRNEEEPRVRDIDLAERLGYERPRVIRELIERLIESGKLNDSDVRRTVRRTLVGVAERDVEELWLTEAQALKVVAKSETAKADAMLDEMILVYRLARRGLLPQQAPLDVAALVEQAMTKVRDSLRADMVAVIGNLKPSQRAKALQPSFWDGPKHAALIDAWDAVAAELDPERQSMTVADALAVTAQDARATSRARMRLHEQFERFLAKDGFDSDAIRLGRLLRQVALRPPVMGRALCRLGSGNVARWGVRVVDARAAS